VASLRAASPDRGTTSFKTAGVPSASVAAATYASVAVSYARPTAIDHSASRSATSAGSDSSHAEAPTTRALLRTTSGMPSIGAAWHCAAAWTGGLLALGPMAKSDADEAREGVSLTNLDQPLFDDAGATKRDLVDYLDTISARILPELHDRPLSVIRVHRGQEAFMQKNVPKYTPEWVPTVQFWAETSKREVSYALCNDRRTLLWFANQRAVEYHPALVRAADPAHATHLVLDLDPPEGEAFPMAVRAALLVRQALADVGLEGAVKTSGAKGVHVFVPIDAGASMEDTAAATRAIAERAARLGPDVATTAFMKEDREGKVFVDSTRVGGATVIAAYSPRVRPGVPVSFPVAWDDLEQVRPSDFTVHTAVAQLPADDAWARRMAAPQALPDVLVAEGHAIPVARVQAMHEGKRRKRARDH
jgi:bifunctional non-homologous end joining protein LigD